MIPEITARMAQSRDPEELKHYWVEWHKASGAKVKHLYPKYVELANEAAVMNSKIIFLINCLPETGF